MPQACGAQTFACEQTVGDQCAGQAMQPFEQEARFFKSAFFAGGINADKHLSRRQDGGKTVHVETMVYRPNRTYLAGAVERKGRHRAACYSRLYLNLRTSKRHLASTLY